MIRPRAPILDRDGSRSRERDALLRCWAEQREELLRFCQRSLGPVDGEDAFSRATVSMLRAGAAPEGIRRPAGWLQEIVSHACVDVHRERSRRRRRLLPAPLGEDIGELATSTSPDPEQTYLARETLDCVERAVRSLPSPLRVPLQMRVADGLPYASMAVVLEESEQNLRKRVQMARRLVRRSIPQG